MTSSAILCRAWGLDSQHGQVRALTHHHLVAAQLGLHPGDILVAGGRVDHQPVTVFGAVDNHVVHHPALLVEHGAVQRMAAAMQTTDIIGQQVL